MIKIILGNHDEGNCLLDAANCSSIFFKKSEDPSLLPPTVLSVSIAAGRENVLVVYSLKVLVVDDWKAELVGWKVEFGCW